MDCVNCARVGSKYCSDQCGLTVASLRWVNYRAATILLIQMAVTVCIGEFYALSCILVKVLFVYVYWILYYLLCQITM